MIMICRDKNEGTDAQNKVKTTIEGAGCKELYKKQKSEPIHLQ